MSSEQDLVLREYEISKDNIRWVMGQLVTVSGTLLAISVVVFRLAFDGDSDAPPRNAEILTAMIIVLVNIVGAFICYQNVQISALQRHIQSLELRLENADIFRWESRIAPIWYGKNAQTVTFNVLVLLPLVALVLTLYYSLWLVMQGSSWFWIIAFGNVFYVAVLIFNFDAITRKVREEIPLPSSLIND